MTEDCSCGSMDLYIATEKDMLIDDWKVYDEGLMVRVSMENKVRCEDCEDVVTSKKQPVKHLVFEADEVFDYDYTFEDILEEIDD